MSPGVLTVDLYELTMAAALLAADDGLIDASATFSLFVRVLPDGWDRLVAAGLDDVLALLEAWRLDDADLAALARVAPFDDRFLAWLAGVRFDGSVRAVAEGTVVGAQVPLLEVDTTLAVGLLFETVLLNQVNLATLLATACARTVEAAEGRALVDFALRRTHGVDAGRVMTRSSWIAGFAGTSNVEAAARYGIPASGTMAHALVQAYAGRLGPVAGEQQAFRVFAERHGASSILLVDTFDIPRGIEHAVAVAREHRIRGVRIDSGDLAALSRLARTRFDAAGLPDVAVFVSGGLDAHDVAALVRGGAPIDGFGVGTRVGVAAEHPWLDSVYKLVACEGRPVRKTSPGKESWPGAKQAWRTPDGRTVVELAAAAGPSPGSGRGVPEPLLHEVMRHGRRLDPGLSDEQTAAAARIRCAGEWSRPAPIVTPGPALAALLATAPAAPPATESAAPPATPASAERRSRTERPDRDSRG